MDGRTALTFVKKHGIVLMSARGPVPSLAEAIAGERIRGSWWAHPGARRMFRVFETVSGSNQVLVCRLVAGKVTFVHRRLWPALVRLAGHLPKRGLAAVRNEHTARGSHRSVVTAFPRWVPKPILDQARRLTVVDAISTIGADLVSKISRHRFAQPRTRPRMSAGG